MAEDKKIIGLQVSKELDAKLNEVAKAKSLSVSAVIRLILLDYFYFERKGDIKWM